MHYSHQMQAEHLEVIAMNKAKKFATRVLLFISVIISLFCYAVSPIGYQMSVFAGGMPEEIPEENLKNAKELWDILIKNGFSEAAAAGVLGNADQESMFTPTFTGRTYQGVFQMSSDQVTNCKTWCASQNPKLEPETIKGQVMFLLTCTWESDFSSFGTHQGLDAFKKLKDVVKAAGEFCACYERAVGGSDVYAGNGIAYQELREREKYAEAFYKLYTGSEPSISDDDSSGDDKKNGLLDGSAVSLMTVSGGKLLNEGYFSSASGISEEALCLPSSYDLPLKDLTELSSWKKNIKYAEDDRSLRYPRAVVMLVGILVTIYSILLYIAYQFDRINNFIELDALGIMTFGKLRISPDDRKSTFNDKHQERKVVVHRDIIIVCLVGVAIGVLLISGKIFEVVVYLMLKIQEVFSKH